MGMEKYILTNIIISENKKKRKMHATTLQALHRVSRSTVQSSRFRTQGPAGDYARSTYGTGRFGPTSQISPIGKRIAQIFTLGAFMIGPGFILLATRDIPKSTAVK